MNPWAKSPRPEPFGYLWIDNLYNGLLQAVFLYTTILVVGYVLDSKERLANQRIETARLSEQLLTAQLHALRRQIEPHFLFNTLNAIAGLVREKRNDAAVSMIAGLSDFLRRVLEDSNRQQVPLEEELEFAMKYLDIQKMRFSERLQVSVNVPSELFVPVTISATSVPTLPARNVSIEILSKFQFNGVGELAKLHRLDAFGVLTKQSFWLRR